MKTRGQPELKTALEPVRSSRRRKGEWPPPCNTKRQFYLNMFQSICGPPVSFIQRAAVHTPYEEMNSPRHTARSKAMTQITGSSPEPAARDSRDSVRSRDARLVAHGISGRVPDSAVQKGRSPRNPVTVDPLVSSQTKRTGPCHLIFRKGLHPLTTSWRESTSALECCRAWLYRMPRHCRSSLGRPYCQK
jgi:hypothetical protein